MYIVRYNAKIKRGRMQNAIAFAKRQQGQLENQNSRIAVNVFGDNDMIAMELEFDDIEAAARHVEYNESEGQADIIDQGWYDISAGNVVELWQVVG